ncbi:hypothetical protein PV326_012529 [Microctonus aethiopoides]|nr:hypothetical protein PV326_012529 [Microctonus aethiopoides]
MQTRFRPYIYLDKCGIPVSGGDLVINFNSHIGLSEPDRPRCLVYPRVWLFRRCLCSREAVQDVGSNVAARRSRNHAVKTRNSQS